MAERWDYSGMNANDTPPLILASASPRRLELLRSVGLSPRVLPASIDESPLADESAEGCVRRLAAEKGRAVRATVGERDAAILSADTAVVVDGRALGKPRDRDEATEMLSALSGRTHQVLTAVWLGRADGGAERLLCERTDVTFRALPRRWIDGYLEVAAWRDKAGGYGIQEHAALFVERIAGSWSNVVGLPLETLPQAFAAIGAERAIGWLQSVKES